MNDLPMVRGSLLLLLLLGSLIQLQSFGQAQKSTTTAIPRTTLLTSTAAPSQPPLGGLKTINIGFLCTNGDPLLDSTLGYYQVAGGLMVAWERVQTEQLMPDIHAINLTWMFDNCIESLSAIDTIKYINSGADVVIGPPCSDSVIIAGTIAKFYSFPLFVWGPAPSPEVNSVVDYPTTVTVTNSVTSQASAVILILKNFEWTDIAFVYAKPETAKVPRCTFFVNALNSALVTVSDINVVYSRQLAVMTVSIIADTLRQVASVSRSQCKDCQVNYKVARTAFVIVCLETTTDRRNFLLAAAQEGFTTNDWVFLFCETRRTGFNRAGKVPFYVADPPDGLDGQTLLAARKSMVLDAQPYNDTAAFTQKVIDAFEKPPFNCTNCTGIVADASRVGSAHDAFYLYALARNRTLSDNPAMSSSMNATTLARMATGSFNGQTGLVRINRNGSRDPVYMLYVLDTSDRPMSTVRIETNTDNLSTITVWNPLFTSEEAMWAARGGVAPQNTPPCGFTGDDCPPSFTEQYLAFVVAAAVVFLVIVCCLITAVYTILRRKQQQAAARDLQWQVPFQKLVKPSNKATTASAHSLQSSVTTSSRFTLESKRETETHAFFFVDGEAVIARKHSERIQLSNVERVELRQVHKLEHDNINKFVGICLDAPQLMTIWRYCLRGSLEDIIDKGSLQMDWFFKYSLMRDICEGMNYLHHATGAHGWLSSRTCVVNERWQLKITFHGPDSIKRVEKRPLKELLWTAPEIMRDGSSLGTKAGDIYSFAIICSEVITRKSAWDLANRASDLDELIYLIKKGGRSPIRPSLDAPDDSEVNSSMILFVKDCWSEEPEARPSAEQAKSLIKSFNHGRSANLMDHVFNVLEQYATNLEEEVDARMKELVEEKKKSDILLYRMLPKQVADKLKLGQSVEPETFECVSIFFSDVVSFTTLASRCTPLQVVNLLNDLYTAFDAIIDEHDVYKVETIGDGYLCVSGLPHRNGNDHAREVAEMSFALLEAIKRFRIPHLPGQRISIRIGLHTGPCVAGVVGITMPRYCLFGDSVNTAARMESNGKPGRIHISEETNRFLAEIIGGYRTESRGEVLIKGKGTMNTFWLLTADEREEEVA